MPKHLKLYKTLMVDSNATDEQIKKAYRTLALEFHPDKVIWKTWTILRILIIIETISESECRRKVQGNLVRLRNVVRQEQESSL